MWEPYRSRVAGLKAGMPHSIQKSDPFNSQEPFFYNAKSTV